MKIIIPKLSLLWLAILGIPAIAANVASAELRITQDPKPWTAPARKARVKNPIEKSSAAVERGRQLFAINCVACHGAEGKGDGAAATALTPRPTDLGGKLAQADSDGAIYWKISNGRAPMPAFDPALTDTERWELVHFIRSLGTPPTPEESTLDSYAELRGAFEKGNQKAFQGAAISLQRALGQLPDPSKAPGLSAEKAKALHQDWAARLERAVAPLKSIAALKADWADAPKMFLATTKGIAEILDLVPTKRLPHAVILWQGTKGKGTEEFWLQWQEKTARNPYAGDRREDGKAVKTWKAPKD